MDAKMWAEMFNRNNPPKKVDIMQMCIVEFKNRPDSPLFHLEHYIEGNYIKYNSNAGFVEDLNMRLTPHAFSHFTFEYSDHQLIVVDIQGVGDLYTDPQIHTAKGTEYGEGNLGIKGFALFFYSHVCNEICKNFGLTQFDLAPSEINAHKKIMEFLHNSSGTKLKSYKRELSSGSNDHYSAKTKYLLTRLSIGDDSNDLYDIVDESNETSLIGSSPLRLNLSIHSAGIPIPNHNRAESHSSGYSNNTSLMETPFNAEFLHSAQIRKPRASGIVAEKHAILNADTEARHVMPDLAYFDSCLGKIHMEVCKYHEFGRFQSEESDAIDYEAAFFHLNQAANLGVTDALVNLSKIYMQLPHDILPDYKVEVCEF